MVVVAPRSAKLVEARGARFTLLVGYVFCLLGFLTMLLLWKEGIAYWKVGLGYALIGIGVGFAGTPGLALADRLGAGPPRRDGLGHRRPAARPRRRDHAVDLRRPADRRLRAAASAAIAASPDGRQVNDERRRRADQVLLQRRRPRRPAPRPRTAIIAAAKASFLQGDDWAYTAGIVAIVLGATLVCFFFPDHREERQLLAEYTAEDEGATAEVTPAAAAARG